MGFFSSKGKTKQQVTPYRQWQLDQQLDRLAQLGRTPMEFFPEQTYAGLQPLQEEALGMQEAYGRQLGGMISPAMQAWQSTLTAPDVANNPYVQNMLEQQQALASRSLREQIPGIESAAIGAGQLGGSRQGVVEAMRERDIRQDLLSQAAQTQMDAYTAGLGQQRFGLSAAPQMAGFGMMGADVLAGVGGARRAEEQLAIDEAMKRFEFEQEEPWMRLQREMGMFQPATTQFAATETTQKTSPSALQIGTQLAGLGMAGFGLFGGGGGSSFGQGTYAPTYTMGGGGSMPGMGGMRGSPWGSWQTYGG